MPEWKPIEAAPKDGTEILAYYDKGKVYDIVSYYDGDEYVGWVDTGDNMASAPTHWMPLPTAPDAA